MYTKIDPSPICPICGRLLFIIPTKGKANRIKRLWNTIFIGKGWFDC